MTEQNRPQQRAAACTACLNALIASASAARKELLLRRGPWPLALQSNVAFADDDRRTTRKANATSAAFSSPPNLLVSPPSAPCSAWFSATPVSTVFSCAARPMKCDSGSGSGSQHRVCLSQFAFHALRRFQGRLALAATASRTLTASFSTSARACCRCSSTLSSCTALRSCFSSCPLSGPPPIAERLSYFFAIADCHIAQLVRHARAAVRARLQWQRGPCL